jgi:ATPases of the AAA+ class
MSDRTLDIVELLLTAQIYNKYPEMDVSDLPKDIRKYYWSRDHKTVPKPIRVTVTDIEKIFDVENINKRSISLPFVTVDDMDFSAKITALEVGAEWFQKKDENRDRISHNPVLAFFYEKKKTEGADYSTAKTKVRPKEVDREWIESLIAEIEKEDGGPEMLKLAQISAPEDIRQTMKDFVLTHEQEEETKKIVKAIKYRDYLKHIGLYDVGKILMVGPPGTGKTSLAKAMSEHLSTPFVEVRLSMITDQYLGETAKNIDRVFALAKKLSPCILFIDEFDFVAKTRSSDEHAALKRAVNTLLKAIDNISLTTDGVLLLAATNHPKMLDSAAWRRFDDIMKFPLPDVEMRKRILDIVTKEIKGDFDTAELAALTHGYSGSDLRMVIREAVLSALLTERTELTQKDMLNAVASFDERAVIKTNEYEE